MERRIGPSAVETLLSTNGKGSRVSHFRTNQPVFSQGEPCDAVFYIQRGNLKLSVLSKRGKRATIAIAGPNDFLGERCLTGQSLHTASAVALTDASVLRIGKNTMARALRDQPAFSNFFLTHLLKRNARIEDDLLSHLFDPSELRLARVLSLLAGLDKGRRKSVLLPRIGQKTLAEMVGTTRPRINFFMNKFKKRGLVEYNGDLRVHRSLSDFVKRNSF